ncbi:hypothetical protein GGI23_000228 [Coemansia sp. RSA 2559]|nr:hypothetical protein GGI23_000228 [Coemansia sp. RSA 2559]KAJ2869597.1 hypothetical protein GGI22_000160 [Coemansia erecta]
MRLSLVQLLVVAALSVLGVRANPIHLSLERLFRRANNNQSSIASLRTGVLVKNGVQTSCELALIDNKAAFVAANCVTDTNGNLDTTNAYAVYYTDSNVQGSNAVSASITSSLITLHPEYSIYTLANNIAILQFNPSQSVSWQNPIAVNKNAWSDTVLSRRRLVSVSSSTWANQLHESLNEASDDCSSNSGLYAANTKDFVCSLQRSAPLMSSHCNIPYGSVYGVDNSNAAVAGLYSYSVISGNQFCGSSDIMSYYLMLSDYIAFAQSTIGRDVSVSFNQGFTVNSASSYSLSQESFSSPSGTSVLTGNVFATNGNNANWIVGSQLSQSNSNSNNNGNNISNNNSSSSNGSSSIVSTPDNTASNSDNQSATASNGASPPSGANAGYLIINGVSSSDYSTSASNTDNGGNINGTAKSSSDSLSGGDIAAIVVCLLIGIVLIAAGLFFGSRWYRQYKLRRRWAPETVQNIVEAQAVHNELGNGIPRSFDLPSYRQHRRTMLVAVGPTSPQ